MRVTTLDTAMSTWPARPSSRSERRPVTSLDPGGNAVVGAVRAETRLEGAPVAGLTSVVIVCASHDAGLTPSSPGTWESGTTPDCRSASASETSRGAASAHALAVSTASSPVGGIGTATPSTVRASTTPSKRRVSTDAAPSASASGSSSGTSTGPSSTGRSKPSTSTDQTRPPARSRASTTTTSKSSSTRWTAAVSPAMPAPITAMRSPGSAIRATCCAAASPESRAPVSVPGASGEHASPAIQSRPSTGSASEARSRGVVPTASYEKAPRANGSLLQVDRRMAVGAGTPSGRGGVGVGVGVALVGCGVRVGSGCGQVQLDSVTAAIPESDAARKVRRAMPPDAARESMWFRLAVRPPR